MLDVLTLDVLCFFELRERVLLNELLQLVVKLRVHSFQSLGTFEECFSDHGKNSAFTSKRRIPLLPGSSALFSDYGTSASVFGTVVACQAMACHLPARIKNVPVLR